MKKYEILNFFPKKKLDFCISIVCTKYLNVVFPREVHIFSQLFYILKLTAHINSEY